MSPRHGGADPSSTAADAAARDAVDFAPGGEIGRYVLLRQLATDATGGTYLAFDPELDRNVAIQLVRLRGSADSDFADGLVAQARAFARLSHPNVIQVYDVGRWRDRVWVAVEYVAGTRLDVWAADGRRSWRDVVVALCAAGAGVEAAHRVDILHLDLKPSSITVGDDGVVRLVDLGLARTLVGQPSDGPWLEPQGRSAVVDAGRFVAPELLRGEAPDLRCDQFGFCTAAWQVLVGERPFAARDAEAYVQAVARGVAIPSRTAVPRRVLDVLAVGLASDPDARHRSFAALLAALRDAVSPWTRPRRVAATLGVLTAGVAVVAWGARPEEVPCRQRARFAAEIWSEARADRIADAFRDTGLPYATHAWGAARRAIDERVGAWTRADLDNCVATEVTGERSVALRERVDACLAQRRREIEALVDVFEAPDVRVVDRAGEAARSLRPAADCVRESDATPATDEADRAIEAALLERLAEVGAAWEAQRMEVVEELASTVVEEARHAGLQGIEAEAQAFVANAAGRQGRTAEAIAGLELAARTADAGGMDRQRYEMLVDLVYMAGHLGGDPRAGHWYARLARAVFDRLGERPGRTATLLLNEGVVYGDEALFDESLASYADALEAWRSDAREPDEALAALLNNIGSTHLLRNDLGAAAAWFLQSYIVRLYLSGPEHPAVADVLVNLGNVFRGLGNREAALASYHQALALFERTLGADPPDARVVLNNIAVVLMDLRRLEEARTAARRTVELYRKSGGDTTAAGAAVANHAEVELLLGDTSAALAGYRRALELVTQAMPQSHPYAINAVSGLARASYAAGDDRSAIAWARWAMALGDPSELPAEVRAEPKVTLARALARRGGSRAIILGLARQALADYEGLGRAGEPGAAGVRELMASLQAR